jgi:hypothetical protein
LKEFEYLGDPFPEKEYVFHEMDKDITSVTFFKDKSNLMRYNPQRMKNSLSLIFLLFKHHIIFTWSQRSRGI